MCVPVHVDVERLVRRDRWWGLAVDWRGGEGRRTSREDEGSAIEWRYQEATASPVVIATGPCIVATERESIREISSRSSARYAQSPPIVSFAEHNFSRVSGTFAHDAVLPSRISRTVVSDPRGRGRRKESIEYTRPDSASFITSCYVCPFTRNSATCFVEQSVSLYPAGCIACDTKFSNERGRNCEFASERG